MKFARSSRAWLACALLSALLFVTAAAAKGGREFSGYFDVSGVQEQGDLVQVTLHLRLFNHDDADVKHVIVTLLEPGPAQSLRGNFQPIKVWRKQRFIELSQEFSVPKLEYAEWMAARQPNLLILFQDSKGQTLQRGAQVSHRPLVPVAQ